MRRTLLIVAVVAGSMACAAQDGMASVIAHWSFDSNFSDATGTYNGVNSSTDTSANTLAAGVVAAPVGGAAPFGGGCLYTGEDYNYVKLPSTISLSATTGYTISLWVNNFRTGNNQDSIPIGDQNNTQNFLAYDSAYNGLRVRMSNQSDNFAFTPTEDAGAWHHLVVSVDPATGVTVYRDNVSKGTNGAKNTMTINAIGFGYSNLGQSTPAMMDWYGNIDEVWLFDQSVTAEQVSNLFTYNALVAPEPATLALLGVGSLLAMRRRRK
jgi:hypothetical protein